jgi:hypothetical protein
MCHTMISESPDAFKRGRKTDETPAARHVAVRLSPLMYEAARQHAEREGVPMSGALRSLIAKGLKQVGAAQ